MNTPKFDINYIENNNIIPDIDDIDDIDERDLLQFALVFIRIQERETNPDKALECFKTRFEIQ